MQRRAHHRSGCQIEHHFDLQWLASDPVPKCLAFKQLHGDESTPIGFVNLEDRADIRVVQRGSSFDFSLKTADGLPIVGEFVEEELQGDVATEFDVFRLIDDTHPAATDFAEDAVVGNRLPYGLRGRGHWVEMLWCPERGGQCSGTSRSATAHLSNFQRGESHNGCR